MVTNSYLKSGGCQANVCVCLGGILLVCGVLVLWWGDGGGSCLVYKVITEALSFKWAVVLYYAVACFFLEGTLA